MAQNTAALVTGRLGFASISLPMSRSSLSAREVMYFSESVVAKAYCAPAMLTRTLLTIAASLAFLSSFRLSAPENGGAEGANSPLLFIQDAGADISPRISPRVSPKNRGRAAVRTAFHLTLL